MHEAVFIISKDDKFATTATSLVRFNGITCRRYRIFSEFARQFHKGQVGCIINTLPFSADLNHDIFRALNDIDCSMPVIVVANQPSVAMAVRTLKAGAFDFIEASFIEDTLVSTVLAALRAARIQSDLDARRAEIAELYQTLTDREEQVLSRIFHGMSNKETAQSLGISSRTVEIYRSNIMSKMKSSSLAELVRKLYLWDNDIFSGAGPQGSDNGSGDFAPYANGAPRTRAVG
jgi:two-component system response regulator FixJ